MSLYHCRCYLFAHFNVTLLRTYGIYGYQRTLYLYCFHKFRVNLPITRCFTHDYRICLFTESTTSSFTLFFLCNEIMKTVIKNVIDEPTGPTRATHQECPSKTNRRGHNRMVRPNLSTSLQVIFQTLMGHHQFDSSFQHLSIKTRLGHRTKHN